MHRLATTAACCALISVAAAKPKVVAFDLYKRAPEESSLQTRDDGTYPILYAREFEDVAIGNDPSLYYINASIGTPPQHFELQLDTGSSDIWVPTVNSDVCSGRDHACAVSGSFDPTKSTSLSHVVPGFNISYADGTNILGSYFTDFFNVGGVTVKNMIMAFADQAPNTPNGIMGIAYDTGESLNDGSPDSIYPSIIDQLKLQNLTNTRAYSLWLNDLSSSTGSILFGGVDTAKYHGSLIALPVLPDATGNSTSSFTVTLTSLEFKNAANKLDYSQDNVQIPVILDSGTTLTYINPNIANDIAGGVGAFQVGDIWLVPCSVGQTGARIEYTFGGPGGPVIAVDMSQLVLPFKSDSGKPYKLKDGTVVCRWGLLPSEEGNPNLFGDTFLRSAYVVYDIDNNIVALAPTNFNATTENVQEIKAGKNLPGVTSTATVTAPGSAATNTSVLPLETAATAYATSQARGSKPTPTFDLSNPNHPTSAASALAGHRPQLTNVLLGASFVTSLMFGGALLVLA